MREVVTLLAFLQTLTFASVSERAMVIGLTRIEEENTNNPHSNASTTYRGNGDTMTLAYLERPYVCVNTIHASKKTRQTRSLAPK